MVVGVDFECGYLNPSLSQIVITYNSQLVSPETIEILVYNSSSGLDVGKSVLTKQSE